ncbi:MAG: hypothetical protein GC159_01185 [Phycisphaera sp.]|nr:hypothetical protein [Phycisphaera sp.]
MPHDYFDESVPDGIANGVMELFSGTCCSGQDGYELLIGAFGDDVDGTRFKNHSEDDWRRMANLIQEFFELDEVTPLQGRIVIEGALRQWGG